MATDIDNLRDIEYLDEELDDIEYTEILSFEEMSKINPSFIALDKEEIYNNLYNFFKDKKKSDLLRSLFYEILVNRESKNGKINDFNNYIFAAEGEIENYYDDNSKEATYNFIAKYNNKRDLREFVKRKFCVSYNRKSNKIGLKPSHDTNTIITDNFEDRKDFPKYYPIIKDYPVINCRNVDKVENIYNINDTEEINLPILGAYYKIPTATTNDYMYAKIASHLLNSINTNFKESKNYKDIYELIKNTRPDISMIINEIDSNKEAFYLDYGNINNIFKKYDYSLDFISEKDLEILSEYMYSIIKNEKERKNTHGGFKIKRPQLINKKLTFFDNIDKTLKVINISPQVSSFLDKTKDIIIKYKSDIIQTDVIPLKNYNIYDIIKQINENAITIEEVIEELKLSIKTINIDHTLATINDILEAKENFEDIKEDCEKVRAHYIYSREHIFDYDKDGKKYVISKRENKAICDGNDIDNYEGLEDDDDIIDDENKGIAGEPVAGIGTGGAGGASGVGGALGSNDISINAINNNYDLNRYIANIHFRNEKGFIEMLRIVLELVKKINDIANIDIDYDEISNYLFKKYRSISTRYETYLREFETKNVEEAKKYAKKYAELTPFHILYSKNTDKNRTDVIKGVIKKVNEEFIETINIIFCNAICFWIVDTQDKIFKGSVALNMNYLNPNHIDKLNARGLLYYIIEIISDFFKYTDNNDYIINTKDLRKSLIFIVENEHKDKGDDIINELINKKNMDAKNKCSVDRNRYIDEELYYIDKLLLTPNNNSKYEKIHKYIQGCCLRKLDVNFNDISDFVNTDNHEIIKLKELYSKVRLINKERDTRYTPPKHKKNHGKHGKHAKKGKVAANAEEDFEIDSGNISDRSDSDDDIYAKEVKEKIKNIKYISKKPFVYNLKKYGVDEWLESMRDKSELLPNDMIDNIINYNIDAIKLVITDNIKRLKNVKNNISGEFLTCKYINYKEILLNVCKILYMNVNSTSKYDNDEILKNKIMKSIKKIKKMIKYLYDLNKNYNTEEYELIDIINMSVISNSLNYPDLSGVENIPKEFISENAEKLYEYLKNYLEGKYNRFLTPEEIAIFINEKREEYKNKKLKENQDLDIEENEIRRQMKAAGIKDAYNNDAKEDAEYGGISDDGGNGDRNGNDDEGDIGDVYKDEEKDADYNSKDNDNYNIYDDQDNDIE
jgi:hypothetical protein